MVEALILIVMLGVCIALLCFSLIDKTKTTCGTDCHCKDDNLNVTITEEDLLNDLTNKNED